MLKLARLIEAADAEDVPVEALAFVLNIEADELAERLRVFALFAHGAGWACRQLGMADSAARAVALARKASQLVAHQPRPVQRLLTTRP
jgi:hypothetical protein